MNIDHFDREYISRDGKAHREGYFPPEQTETAVVQLEVVFSKVSLRGRFEKFRLWQVKTTVEYIVGQYEVSAKPVTLERKEIQSTKPALVGQLSHTFDHACGQALYACHAYAGVVSPFP